MKKLLLLFLLIPAVAYAWGVLPLGGGVVAESGGSDPCGLPDTTYDIGWTGDHATGTTYFCLDSGDDDKNGTNSGGTISDSYGTDSSNGFRRTGNDQYISVAGSSNDILQATTLRAGTMWASVYLEADTTAPVTVAEAYIDADNLLSFLIYTNAPRLSHKGSGTSAARGGGTVITNSGWARVGWSWDDANNVQSFSETSSTWEEKSVTMGVMGSAIATVNIGEYEAGGSESDTARIDNVIFLPGYQTSDPE